MNSFTKVAKAVVTGFVLGGVLMTTACATDSHPAASTPTSPAASQSESATPTATPTESQAPVVTGPLGVDMSKVVIDATVAKTFPTETEASLKEGVTFALTTYQGLVGMNNFYHARTASDNTLLVPNADKFDKTYYDAMTARTTANNGQIQDIIAFGREDGGITKGDLGVHVMDPNKSVQFVTGPPVVYAGTTPANGNVLVVKANAKMFAPTADNKLVTIDFDYWVNISHVGPGKWLVEDMGYKLPSNPVVTDSVADPKAPNGK